MKIIKRFLHSRRSNGQAGQALILVLLFLAMGSLTLVPTLSHVSTALKTGEIYEENTNELYTADAGIEDSLWRIKYDFMGTDYNPYDFVSEFPYQTEDVNGMTADFTIMNVWFPTDFNLADPDDPDFMSPEDVQEMMDLEKLIVAGGPHLSDNTSPYTYRIMIDFNPGAGDNLTIKSLGVWLPKGFTYADSCSLEDVGQPELDDIAGPEDAPGGSTVLWSYDDDDYPYLDDLLGFDSVDMTFIFTFEFTASTANVKPAAIAWVTTEMRNQYGNPKFPPNDPANVPVSWDIDTSYYKIVSEAGDTSVEAYTSKNDLRQMGDAMSGDYVAIGNSLLTDHDGNNTRTHWQPGSFDLRDPTDNVSIPENADVIYAYLYWAGWRNSGYIEDVSPFPDSCSDFDLWDRSSSPDSQTKVPTAEGINNGTWNTTPYWSKVDETTPDDTDYITGTGTAQSQTSVPNGDGYSSGSWTYYPSGWPWNYYSLVNETTPNDSDYITGTTDTGNNYRLFNFSAFSVPVGANIDGLTIYFRARDLSGTNPNNNLSAYLRVDGNNYQASESVDPTTTFTTYQYTFTTNPRNGNPWTREDINGWGSDPLQQFGIYSTDFNPDIRVSMVYARVDYSSGGYRLFDFQDFTVPDNSEVESLTIYFRAKDASGPDTNNLRASIYVHNTRYDASTGVDPTTSWMTYSYTFDENPETGNPWTWQEINGGSSIPLLQFGVYSTDLAPDIQISMVYATATYFESRWTVVSGEFRGQGSTSADPEAKILTLKDGLDLSAAGVYNISWDQRETGTLSDEDIFSFAFSGDGGDSWSPYYEAFRDDVQAPVSPFSIPIPDEYKTDDFKIRFYFNFNAASEFVYLDDIEVTYLPVDMDVVFKINDQQVYLDEDNQPAAGLDYLTAGRSYAMLNQSPGYGFSYMCVRDVSALVKKYPIDPDEEHHTGNAKYTVDGVAADITNPYGSLDFAYAGWSLIIIYANPETAGHYIYIRDNNFAYHPGLVSGYNLDFDMDGVPGGTITGFKVPDPVLDQFGQIDDPVAARITCFVTEGDDFGTSSVKVTGQQSEQWMNLTNDSCGPNDVWNDASYPVINEGVDIDTFELEWDDGILTPGDNELKVDMYSMGDAWNLVYFIISIRSETVTSGTSHYTIHGG